MRGDIEIRSLFIGQVQDRWQGRPPSAIAKQDTSGPLDLIKTGFVGDAQADLKVHGGFEKAVHHYPADHYTRWTSELGARPTFAPGGFGENISTLGLDETQVCVGDTFRLGTATVQISQGRQPCWKLSAHTQVERMAYLVQKTALTGWYYRVLEDGVVQRGDTLIQLDRPHPDWSVKRVTCARFDPKLDVATAEALSELRFLNEGWRTAFLKKAKGAAEDTRRRLDG